MMSRYYLSMAGGLLCGGGLADANFAMTMGGFFIIFAAISQKAGK